MTSPPRDDVGATARLHCRYNAVEGGHAAGVPAFGIPLWYAAGERGEINLNEFKDLRTENGSSQGQNMALTGLCVSNSLDSGT